MSAEHGGTILTGDTEVLGGVLLTEDTEVLGGMLLTGDTEVLGGVLLTGDTEVLGDRSAGRNDTDRGHRSSGRKTCHSATLCTTNLTWTDLGSNPDLRGVSPSSNRLSHGTAPVGRAHRSSWHSCVVLWTSDRLS
jgi:hypothetical protein